MPQEELTDNPKTTSFTLQGCQKAARMRHHSRSIRVWKGTKEGGAASDRSSVADYVRALGLLIIEGLIGAGRIPDGSRPLDCVLGDRTGY